LVAGAWTAVFDSKKCGERNCRRVGGVAADGDERGLKKHFYLASKDLVSAAARTGPQKNNTSKILDDGQADMQTKGFR